MLTRTSEQVSQKQRIMTGLMAIHHQSHRTLWYPVRTGVFDPWLSRQYYRYEAILGVIRKTTGIQPHEMVFEFLILSCTVQMEEPILPHFTHWNATSHILWAISITKISFMGNLISVINEFPNTWVFSRSPPLLSTSQRSSGSSTTTCPHLPSIRRSYRPCRTDPNRWGPLRLYREWQVNWAKWYCTISPGSQGQWPVLLQRVSCLGALASCFWSVRPGV